MELVFSSYHLMRMYIKQQLHKLTVNAYDSFIVIILDILRRYFGFIGLEDVYLTKGTSDCLRLLTFPCPPSRLLLGAFEAFKMQTLLEK